jgi:hypothetical protein
MIIVQNNPDIEQFNDVTYKLTFKTQPQIVCNIIPNINNPGEQVYSCDEIISGYRIGTFPSVSTQNTSWSRAGPKVLILRPISQKCIAFKNRSLQCCDDFDEKTIFACKNPNDLGALGIPVAIPAKRRRL